MITTLAPPTATNHASRQVCLPSSFTFPLPSAVTR